MREQTRDRCLARTWRAPQDQRPKRAAANETRQRAVGSQQMILAHDLARARRPQAIGERPGSGCVETGGAKRSGLTCFSNLHDDYLV